MKLVIQVPAWNEETSLHATLAELPRFVPGVDEIEVLVVDDGSTDATAEVARSAGASVYRLPLHQGLARTFSVAISESLARGADVIVNTDADGQYDPAAISSLIAPILDRRADIVLGDRSVATIAHFSRAKRWLQRLGARLVRLLAGVPVFDATTGMRAFSRAAAARLNAFTKFTYTLETLIQAGQADMTVVSVPVTTRATSRPSRLFRSNLGYVTVSLINLVRLVFIYRPLRVLLILGTLSFAAGAGLAARYLYFFFASISPEGHVQSLIAAAVLGLTGIQLAVLGILADLTSVNRRLLEELRARQREQK